MPERVYTVLMDATRLVEDGWIQGMSRYVSPEGREYFCAGGAIDRAAETVVRPAHTATLAIGAVVESITPLPSVSPRATLAAWNDSGERTVEDVARVMRKVAVAHAA